MEEPQKPLTESAVSSARACSEFSSGAEGFFVDSAKFVGSVWSAHPIRNHCIRSANRTWLPSAMKQATPPRNLIAWLDLAPVDGRNR